MDKSYKYLAPEILLGGNHTFQSDLWSLGCIVVEMLTGKNIWYQDKNIKENKITVK